VTWTQISNPQTPNWTDIANQPTSGVGAFQADAFQVDAFQIVYTMSWANIDDTQTPNWSSITNSQTSGWAVIVTPPAVTWTQI